jgi:hypothetical protein
MRFVKIRAGANLGAVDIDLNDRRRCHAWLRAHDATCRATALDLPFPDQIQPPVKQLRRADPISRASAETFAPASQLRAAISALKASDQRDRPPTSAPSIRSATALIK